jgi:hypothetical protein
MSNVNNFLDPANLGSLKGLLRLTVDNILKGVNGMLPCEVIAFNRNDPNRVQVQHVIDQVTTDMTSVSRGQVASLPVLQLGGGDFLINFNIKTGDKGWILACDRDISLFLQSYKTAQPNTFRKFSFSDALFIPDVMTGYTIDPEDAENMVIRSVDGLVKISLGADKIKIKAPNVEIEGDTTVDVTSPEVTINASTSVIVTSPEVIVDASTSVTVTSPNVNINASGVVTMTTTTLAVVGDITYTGTITHV